MIQLLFVCQTNESSNKSIEWSVIMSCNEQWVCFMILFFFYFFFFFIINQKFPIWNVVEMKSLYEQFNSWTVESRSVGDWRLSPADCCCQFSSWNCFKLKEALLMPNLNFTHGLYYDLILLQLKWRTLKAVFSSSLK